MLEITTTRHNPLVDPAARRLELGDPGLPVPRRHRRRHDGAGRHRRCCASRAATTRSASSRCRRRCSRSCCMNARHVRAVPRPRAQALRLARLLDVRAQLADVVGLVGADPRLRACSLASALLRLPDAWPWLARARAGRSHALSDCARRAPARSSGCWAGRTSRSASALGIYTGILLNTMVARPLWNSAILGPLFLFSGLSAGAALIHLATRRAAGPPGAAGHGRRRARRAVAAARAGSAAARAPPMQLIARRPRVSRDRARADRAPARQSATRRRPRTPRRPR